MSFPKSHNCLRNKFHTPSYSKQIIFFSLMIISNVLLRYLRILDILSNKILWRLWLIILKVYMINIIGIIEQILVNAKIVTGWWKEIFYITNLPIFPQIINLWKSNKIWLYFSVNFVQGNVSWNTKLIMNFLRIFVVRFSTV